MLLSFPVIVDKFFNLAAGKSAQVIDLLTGETLVSDTMALNAALQR